MHPALDAPIQPAADVMESAKRWLAPVRAGLGAEFVAAYLTGSVLRHGFDPRHSHVNVLVVARTLGAPQLDALSGAVSTRVRPPVDPLFVSRDEIEQSLDVFPIEWAEVQQRHLLLEGTDVFQGLPIAKSALRLQCEHELRGKHLRLRQAFVLARSRPDHLIAAMRGGASGLATLMRTALRLRGETPPAHTPEVIERVASLYALDARALLIPHQLRSTRHRPGRDEMLAHYRTFLAELQRLIAAVDGLPAE
jgi:hypothetical protein